METEASVDGTAEDSGADLAAELDEIYAAHEEGDADGQARNAEALPDAKPEPAQAENLPPMAAPATWDKAAKEAWEQLPRALQEQVAKRETDRERAVHQVLKEKATLMQGMRPILEGFNGLQEYFTSFRGSDGAPLWGNPQAMMKEISDVLATKSLLMRDPQAGLQAILQWAQAAGLDLSGEGKGADPEVLRMRQKIAALEADSHRRNAAEREQRAYAQQREAVAQIAHGLNDFAQAKDDAGQARYPHLFGDSGEQVGELMGRWMRANAGADGITPELFAQAYEVATLSVPATREAVFKEREDARVLQFKERSARARKAAGINPGPKRSPDIDPQKSESELMDEIWRKYNAS